MTNKKILFGIICFREKYYETVTYTKLLESYKKSNINTTLNIFVFDNTDYEVWDFEDNYMNEEDVNVIYQHFPENPGISSAVNTFSDFAKDRFDWIVILDQDTSLPYDFFSKYYTYINSEYSYNIALPKVFSNHKMISPSLYKFYRTSEIPFSLQEKIELKNITAINSGLLIKNSFLQKYSYDPNLRIDFCDHEFFERINGKKYFAKIMEVTLNQNFSSDTDDETKSLVRYKLYKRDMINYRKGKNKLMFFLRVDLPHLVKLTLKYKTLGFLKIRLT